MTDQPKPRVPLSEADRQMLIYLSDANSSARVAIDLDSALRAALNLSAEQELMLDGLRNELATTSKGSMTVERMQGQLAQVTAERNDAALKYSGMVSIDIETQNKIIASAAENVLLRDALEFYAAQSAYWEIRVGGSTLREGMNNRANEALSLTPTALVGAIDGIREVLVGIKDQCAPGTGCKIQQALAAFDDALGKGKV